MARRDRQKQMDEERRRNEEQKDRLRRRLHLLKQQVELARLRKERRI
jgi:hypothetical protein